MKKVVIGIDIGGTNTIFGVVDRKGNILGNGSVSTNAYSKIETFIEQLSLEINKVTEKIKERVEIKGIGIGAPNGNYYNGTIEFAPNLRWKGVVNLVDLFGKNFNVPIKLTNDANAAAIGEMVFGKAQNINNFILIYLGKIYISIRTY